MQNETITRQRTITQHSETITADAACSGGAPGLQYGISPQTDIEILFVIRESDESDLVLFDQMRYQTYVVHRGDPLIAAIMAAGMNPLHCDSEFELTVPTPTGPQTIKVQVEIHDRGRSKARLFRVGNTAHLWSRGTAAIENEDRTNDFTEILTDVVTELRPRIVTAANFSRLIRNQDQGSSLSKAFSNNGVEVVQAGGMDFPFQGPKAGVGKLMFSVFAMVAEMERNWIVTRLLAGKVASWRRGEWPYGKNTVPFGYTYEPASRRLVPDLSKRGKVRSMLLALSSGSAPLELVEQLASYGVTSMRPGRRDATATLAATGNPRQMIDNFFAWAPLWVSGEYLYRVTSSLKDTPELAGLTLSCDPTDPDDRGELQMLSRVDMPTDGWAEPSVLEAFRAAALQRATELRGTHSRSTRPLTAAVRAGSADVELLDGLLNPQAMRGIDQRSRREVRRRRGQRTLAMLSGMTWAAGRTRFELQVVRRGVYKLLAWPSTAQTTETGPKETDR